MDNDEKKMEIYSLLVTNDKKAHDEAHSAARIRKVLWFASVVAVALIVIMLGYRVNYLGDKERQQQRQRYYESAANLPRDSSSSLHENHDLESSILMADHFIDYLKRHKKNYATSEETMKRFQAFLKSKKMEIEHNSKGKFNAEYGENTLSDWTNEEFEKMLLPKDFYKNMREKSDFIKPIPQDMNYEMNAPFPDFFDWRAKNIVTPVKWQGKCGSCWAFAATATVEAAWALAHNGEWRNLSEQTLLDCDLNDNACDGGDEDKAFRYIHRSGLAYAVDLPYVAHRQNSCVVKEDWNVTKIQVAYYIHPDEQSMLQWLVNFGPVNIGMSVTQPMRAYKGGVFTPDKYACKHEVIGLHALLIVGFGTSEKGEKYWIVKNSWGQDYGVENGYIYFARGINACGIEEEPVGILA